jgi:hypothetical protein
MGVWQRVKVREIHAKSVLSAPKIYDYAVNPYGVLSRDFVSNRVMK